jgi:hypothetical protein
MLHGRIGVMMRAAVGRQAKGCEEGSWPYANQPAGVRGGAAPRRGASSRVSWILMPGMRVWPTAIGNARRRNTREVEVNVQHLGLKGHEAVGRRPHIKQTRYRPTDRLLEFLPKTVITVIMCMSQVPDGQEKRAGHPVVGPDDSGRGARVVSIIRERSQFRPMATDPVLILGARMPQPRLCRVIVERSTGSRGTRLTDAKLTNVLVDVACCRSNAVDQFPARRWTSSSEDLR